LHVHKPSTGRLGRAFPPAQRRWTSRHFAFATVRIFRKLEESVKVATGLFQTAPAQRNRVSSINIIRIITARQGSLGTVFKMPFLPKYT
jgi:hypothetical protein